MNVLIVCAVGMSSSALTEKAREAVRRQGIPEVKIGSCGSSQAHNYAMQADLVLLAPQISYMKEELNNKGYTRVLVMPQKAYGIQDENVVVDMILHPENYEHPENASFPKLKKVQKLAEKIGTNYILRAITDSLTDLLPISIIGSAFSLIRDFPVQQWIDYIDSTAAGSLLDTGYQMTIGLMSLYLALQLPYHIAREKNSDGTGVGVTAIACFMIITDARTSGGFDTTYFGIRGMFTAMFTSWIVAELFVFTKRHADAGEGSHLPRNIENSFRSLLPALVCVSVVLAGSTLFKTLMHTPFPEWVESFVTKPIAAVAGTTPYSYLMVTLFGELLWFCGMHGGQITSAVINPILETLSLANIEAWHSGQVRPYMVVTGGNMMYTFGGAGSTLALSLLMLLFAKSRKLKSLGKISFPMGIFFINEPVLFGLPIVLNPILLLPFLLIPIISGALTYSAMSAGLLPRLIGFTIPWTTPPIISGVIEGGWRCGLWQIFIFTLQLMMWYPFFRILDKEEMKKEN